MKYLRKGNKLILKNECTLKFKRELTQLIKEIMKAYDFEKSIVESNKAFVSILNSNICVLVDNHFLDKEKVQR